MLRIVARYADVWNTWGRPDLIAHKSAVLDDYCAELGRDPKAIARTAQALTVVDGPVPEGLPVPVIGGSAEQLAATVAEYQEVGLDELIVPDGMLGKSADRLKAMDVVLDIVRG
jgi:alkanesulfonate monooxygenase SsuD/methylene tetrahydromethanopterin reductase-like flavin-dependent oxidoreductase (luciferase family)